MNLNWTWAAWEAAQNAQHTAKFAERRSWHLRRRLSASKKHMLELQLRLEENLLLCEAMWSLLSEKLGLNEDDLKKKINELDLSDGRMDGRAQRPSILCPKCERELSLRFLNCIYCGQVL